MALVPVLMPDSENVALFVTIAREKRGHSASSIEAMGAEIDFLPQMFDKQLEQL